MISPLVRELLANAFSIRLYFFALGMSFGIYFMCLAIIGFTRKRPA